MKAKIRWMIRRDLPHVLEIEREAYGFPEGEDELNLVLRQRNVVAMVAEHETGEILGHMIYELQPDHFRMLSLAVAKDWRRQGIGRELIAKLLNKLVQQGRSYVSFEVHETCLPVQLFLRSQGFSAVAILKGIDEDAYVMERHVESVAR